MIPDGDAHVLLTVKPWFVAAVTGQDVVVFQHIEYHLVGCMGRQNLAEEIVGL